MMLKFVVCAVICVAVAVPRVFAIEAALDQWSFSLLAGSSITYTDGTGAGANFHDPRAACPAAANHATLITEASQHTVRHVTVGGVVSTVIGTQGNTAGGPTAGTGAAAVLPTPQGIVINELATTTQWALVCQYAVMVFDSVYATSLLAGSGTAAYLDATGSAARFPDPRALSVLSATEYLIGDEHRVRHVTTAGVTTTVAGSASSGCANGAGASAAFDTIKGMDEAHGYFWIIGANAGIARMDRSYNVEYVVGDCTTASSVDGIGTAALLNGGGRIAYSPEADLLVFREGTVNKIRVIDPITLEVRDTRMPTTSFRAYFTSQGSSSQVLGTSGLGEVLVVDASTQKVFEMFKGKELAFYNFNSGVLRDRLSSQQITLGADGYFKDSFQALPESAIKLPGTANSYATVPNSALMHVSQFTICMQLRIIATAGTAISAGTTANPGYLRYALSGGTTHTFTYAGTSTSTTFAYSASGNYVCLKTSLTKLWIVVDGVAATGTALPATPYIPRFVPEGIVLGALQGAVLSTFSDQGDMEIESLHTWNYLLTDAEIEMYSDYDKRSMGTLFFPE